MSPISCNNNALQLGTLSPNNTQLYYKRFAAVFASSLGNEFSLTHHFSVE